MVRSAVADDRLLSYLRHVQRDNPFAIGLILGQSSSGKDYVIHFARTPLVQSPESQEHFKSPQLLKGIDDVDEDWVADHARQATRMLPGGMYVLGIFIVSTEDVVSASAPKIRGILSRLHKQLELQKYLFGNPNSEKLVLNYQNDHQMQCSSFDNATGRATRAEFKFLGSPIKWTQVNCKYQMEQVYHIGEGENDWPLKKHIAIILDRVSKNLKSSVFLFDAELKEGDELIDSIGKKKLPRSGKSAGHDEAPKPIQVQILQPCEGADQDSFEVSASGNQIKIFGNVVSKLWLSPRYSIGATSEAVLEDIMRSLSTRLEMHWDSLTEEEHAEDVNSVHEPPRRVLISLPHSNIAISDYLFPGEGPHDAKISLEEMLDIEIGDDAEVVDAEGQADMAEYCSEALDTESEEVIAKKARGHQQALYFIGLGVALLVLFISLAIHFLQN